jgi:hypothetical protein
MGTGRLFLAAWMGFAPATVAAQISVTMQGGIHAARLDRPERRLDQPGRGIFMEGARGEATTLGLRAGIWWSAWWGVDAGLAWSRNKSFDGGFSGVEGPDFEVSTIFTSATIRARLTRPDAPVGLTAGIGPAVIFHAGSGTSLLTRNADLGGLASLGGSVRVSHRLSITTDVQQYFFNSQFSESFEDFRNGAVRPAGGQGRHELVVLAGVRWEK